MNELNNMDEFREKLIDKLDDQRFGDNVVNKKLLYKDIEWVVDELLDEFATHITEQVRLELETLRKSMRGEYPDQYRPRDMVSMSFVEEVIDAHLAQLKDTTLLEGGK